MIQLNSHVHSGPGNWLAKRLGLDQAPVTTIESASAVLNTVSNNRLHKGYTEGVLNV